MPVCRRRPSYLGEGRQGDQRGRPWLCGLHERGRAEAGDSTAPTDRHGHLLLQVTQPSDSVCFVEMSTFVFLNLWSECTYFFFFCQNPEVWKGRRRGDTHQGQHHRSETKSGLEKQPCSLNSAILQNSPTSLPSTCWQRETSWSGRR